MASDPMRIEHNGRLVGDTNRLPVDAEVDAATLQAAIAAAIAADPLTMTHTAVNVNGNTVVIAANANRRYLLIVNDSDTLIYLALGGAAAVNTGIPLVPNQLGIIELYGDTLYRGAVNANHGGGAVNKRLLVTEGV